MKNLRAAVIGLGSMGANHIRVLREISGVDLVAGVDLKKDELQVAGDFHSFRELSESFYQSELDYCILATPTSTHKDIAIELIRRNINVLIEKPIAPSFSQAMEICEEAEKLKVIVGVGHIERYNSALREAKNRINQGQLGVVHQISTRRQGPYPLRITDIGVAHDLATHDVDLTSWIAGKEYMKLCAQAAFRSKSKNEDLIAVTGLLQGGIVVNHLVNWMSPIKERKVIITGEKGTLVADTLRSDLAFYENGVVDITRKELTHFSGISQGNVISYAFDKPEPLRVEHENFRDAILKKDSEIVTPRSAANTAKIIDAILESSKHGISVNL
jgi:UDP-N-acetylglucosamine 3-dehydrogenase